MEKGTSIRMCFVCGKKVYYPPKKLFKSIFGFCHEPCFKEHVNNLAKVTANNHINLVRKNMIEAMFSKHSKAFKEKQLQKWIEKENKVV